MMNKPSKAVITSFVLTSLAGCSLSPSEDSGNQTVENIVVDDESPFSPHPYPLNEPISKSTNTDSDTKKNQSSKIKIEEDDRDPFRWHPYPENEPVE